MGIFGKRSIWRDHVPFDDLRTRSRLLIVDDKPFPYTTLLNDHGYNVTEKRDVVDLHAIESGQYDLVLLDLHGVGVGFSERQGVGVLEHLKTANPTQIVVIYSAGTFGLADQHVLALADTALPKAAEYLEFKRCIDSQLHRRYTKEFYVERALERLPNADERTRKAVIRSVERGRPDVLQRALESHTSVAMDKERAMQVVQTAASVGQLIAQLAA